jgi:hypothetical protein
MTYVRFNVTEQWIWCRVTVKFLNLILTLISVDLNVIVSKPKNIHDELYFIFVKCCLNKKGLILIISGKVWIGFGFLFIQIFLLICWEYMLLVQMVFNTQCEETESVRRG